MKREKNKNLKKRFTFLLLIALVCFSSTFLVACGNDDDDSTSEDGVVELTWYMIGTPQEDLEMVLEAANEYTAEKIGVTVDMIMIDWGDYDQKMQTVISSGEEYDIAFTCSWAANYAQNAADGAFVDITEMMEGSELEEVIHPAFIEGAKIDGSLYAVPTNKEVAEQWVYVFNQELCDKYGIDPTTVDSLDDLEPMFEVIKANEPEVTCMAFTPILPVANIYDDNSPFAVPFEGEDEIVNKYELPQVQEQLYIMRDYYEKGYLPADVATTDYPFPFEGPQNWFVRKEMYQPGAEEMWERQAGYDLTVVPITETPIITTGSVTGSMNAISVTSDHPEEAFEYLTLLNTDPYLRTLLDYGIEGVHYEDADGDGLIEWLPAHENYSMPSFALGNMFILPLFETDPSDKWEQFEAFNNSAVVAPSCGFYFDPSEVQNEVAAISSVAAEFAPTLMYGCVDTDEYLQKMNDKYEEAGIDKVLEEMNKQYDEWKAQKSGS